MNKELEAKLLEIINNLQVGITDNIPPLVAQYLAYETLSAYIAILATITLFTITVILVVKSLNKGSKLGGWLEANQYDDKVSIVIAGLFALCSLSFVAILISSFSAIPTLIKIYIAPDLVAIDYLKSLIP